MNEAPFATLNVGEILQRYLLPARRGHSNVADFIGSVAILAVETNDQVELPLTLNDLCRDVAADRGLNQPVDVRDVQSVPGDLRAIDMNRQARLSELLDERHVTNAAHLL